MVLGPLYLFANASPLQPMGGGWRRLGELLLPSAHAHEGFFAGGRVLGEWDREVVFDLLAEPGSARVLGRAPGIAGRARSLSLLLQPPSRSLGTEAAALEGHSVWLEGTAEREGRRVPFGVTVDFPAPVEMQRVDFVPIEVELGVSVENLLDARWREAEFNYVSNFRGPDAPASLLATRHFSAGAPRMALVTFTLHLDLQEASP